MPRVIDVLRARGLNGGAARDALKFGKVWVRGAPTADGGREVAEADLTIHPAAPRITVGRDPAFVFKDSHLVVLWKPSGLLAVPAPRQGGHKSALGAVSRVLGSAFAVHRLDEETSGLMAVALDEPTQVALKDLFERHEVERRYLALVSGRFQGERSVRSWMVRDRGDGKRGSVRSGDPVPGDAKEAITHVRALEPVGASATLVEVRLETGRTHQVRVHMAELGHPVLGDTLYGGRAAASRASRVALHAAVLGFEHPISRAKLRFEAPLADDLERLRRALIAVGQPQTKQPPSKQPQSKRAPR